MAETLKYGDELLARFPDNQTGLITAQDMREFVVSTRVSYLNITERTTFTAPMDDGVATLINPLLPAPQIDGTLWTVDSNNRAYQNYTTIIPTLTIPAGYEKLVNLRFMLGMNKASGGEDDYLLQLDMDGAPYGNGILHTLTTKPLYFAASVAINVAYDTQHLFGLSVTPQGTNDDIEFQSFQMVITDYQLWSAP